MDSLAGTNLTCNLVHFWEFPEKRYGKDTDLNTTTFNFRLELTVLLMNEDLFLTVHDVDSINPDIAHVDYQQVHFALKPYLVAF